LYPARRMGNACGSDEIWKAYNANEHRAQLAASGGVQDPEEGCINMGDSAVSCQVATCCAYVPRRSATRPCAGARARVHARALMSRLASIVFPVYSFCHRAINISTNHGTGCLLKCEKIRLCAQRQDRVCLASILRHFGHWDMITIAKYFHVTDAVELQSLAGHGNTRR
jgi:hypothetical protein